MFRLKTVSRFFATLVVLGTLGCGSDQPGSGQESGAPLGAESPATASTQMAPTTGSGTLLDPDAAAREQLTSLPHITPELADRLIAARPFGDMRQVDALLAETLDEGQREEVYAGLFKPLDLNAATDEEILLIPGVGSRMAHEFEEYRPYAGIEQFRREIGKYVDDAEVARLERYVRIP